MKIDGGWGLESWTPLTTTGCGWRPRPPGERPALIGNVQARILQWPVSVGSSLHEASTEARGPERALSQSHIMRGLRRSLSPLCPMKTPPYHDCNIYYTEVRSAGSEARLPGSTPCSHMCELCDLGKLLSPAVPQFPQLQNGSRGFIELTHVRLQQGPGMGHAPTGVSCAAVSGALGTPTPHPCLSFYTPYISLPLRLCLSLCSSLVQLLSRHGMLRGGQVWGAH